VWEFKRTAFLAAALCLGLSTSAFAAGSHGRPASKAAPGAPNSSARRGKLDHELTQRSTRGGTSKVIVTLQPGATLPPEFARYTRAHGRLRLINGQVLEVPNSVLRRFAAHPSVFKIDFDRPIAKSNLRTALTIGSPAAQFGYGFTGQGIGVAIIDSGITSWHDDLTSRTGSLYPWGNQRVSAFVDFVNGGTQPYDDDGHGTHVAGIIAGNGYDSLGQKAGVAPDASLVSLKVLDASGNGNISNIIAAFDWIVEHHTEYNIRVVNASVGAAIRESYWTDPLTLAAKRVVDAGVVVVTAAGNLGRNAAGEEQYGGITAPGNAPWVLTVGASSTNGTPARGDDTMASFSSRGPTFKDWNAKPDLVAPGVGTVSLANPLSNYYVTKSQYLAPGQLATPFMPYLSLSGTSMAAPVVSGTVALMLQANPALTPNMVKAILQYTAETNAGYNALTQGAGFLNALGAVRLAQFFAGAQPGQHVPLQTMWNKHIIWGTHRLGGGVLDPAANAFALGVNWGVATTADGDNIVWGTVCGNGCDGDNIVWGTGADGDNIVWGTASGGDGDNIVWGTNDADNIVWGTDCGGADCDNVAWGITDGDNIVWGTANDGDNIVWGTVCGGNGCDGDNIVWGTSADGDNIVWGTGADGDNIVWGTNADGDNIVWGTLFNGGAWVGSNGSVVVNNWPSLVSTKTDGEIFELLAIPPPPPPVIVPVDPPTVPPIDPITPPTGPVAPPTCDPTVTSCVPPPCDPTITVCWNGDPTALLPPALDPTASGDPTSPTNPTSPTDPTAPPPTPVPPVCDPTTTVCSGGL